MALGDNLIFAAENGTLGIIYQTNLTTTSYTPSSDLPTGNYRVWVRAVSSSLTATWSKPVEFTIAGA